MHDGPYDTSCSIYLLHISRLIASTRNAWRYLALFSKLRLARLEKAEVRWANAWSLAQSFWALDDRR